MTRFVCAFDGCKNSTTNQPFCSYFKFPNDESLLSQWKSVCSEKHDFDYNKSKLCSEHFLKKDILVNAVGHRRLRKNAVPKKLISSHHLSETDNSEPTRLESNNEMHDSELSSSTYLEKSLESSINDSTCGQIIFLNATNNFIYRCLFCDSYFPLHLHFVDHVTIHLSVNNYDFNEENFCTDTINSTQSKIAADNSNNNTAKVIDVSMEPINNSDEYKLHSESNTPINFNLINNTEFDSNICESIFLEDLATDSCIKTSENYVSTKTISKKKIKEDSEGLESCCDVIFKSKFCFLKHRKNFHNEYGCSKCNMKFSTSNRLNNHRKKHYNLSKRKISTKLVECNICFIKIRETSITAHIRRLHKGEMNVKCNYCDKKFLFNADRRVHERFHTKERNFQCENCGLKFTTSSGLVKHSISHQSERNHKCSVCSKSFKAKSNLKKHFDVHATEKKFQCDQCDAKFITKRYLRQHKYIHNLEHKYECKICNKTFSQNAGLYSHKKSHGLIL